VGIFPEAFALARSPEPPDYQDGPTRPTGHPAKSANVYAPPGPGESDRAASLTAAQLHAAAADRKLADALKLADKAKQHEESQRPKTPEKDKDNHEPEK
jgi:hypothetical protein